MSQQDGQADSLEWDLTARKETYKLLEGFIRVHSSLAAATQKWKATHPFQSKAHFAPGDSGEEELPEPPSSPLSSPPRLSERLPSSTLNMQRPKIHRRPPPHRLKRLKTVADASSVSIPLSGALSNLPVSGPSLSIPQQLRDAPQIPVMIAGATGQRKRPADSTFSEDELEDLDFSLPLEPDGWDLLEPILNCNLDYTTEVMADEQVEAVLEQADAVLSEPVLAGISPGPEDSPMDDVETPTLLREEYLRYLYALDALTADSACGGRICCAARRLQSKRAATEGFGAAAAQWSDRAASLDPGIQPQTPSYRCRDCLPVQTLCEECVVAEHSTAVLHRIERWNGSGKVEGGPLDDGELCVQCPACPHPNINLPEGWETSPNRRLLYGKFISGDGNFHLVRRRNRAGTGANAAAAALRRSSMVGNAGFWVPHKKYAEYLKTSKPGKEKIPNECNTIAGDPHRTSSSTSNKNDVSGAFALSCEGFYYVDVPMASVIDASIKEGLKDMIISYDIACKYSINFIKRVCDSPYPLLPPNLQSLVSIMWLIGKFHLGGHREECQKAFNFNYTSQVGRMSGELVETIWAYFDYLKYQTREMGPGSRQEMLSDAMNYWNWQKLVKLSDVTRAALLQANVQTEHARTRLQGIEDHLGPELLQRLRVASDASGTEQYLPNKHKTRFPTQKSVLSSLIQDETDEPTSTDAAGTARRRHATAREPRHHRQRRVRFAVQSPEGSASPPLDNTSLPSSSPPQQLSPASHHSIDSIVFDGELSSPVESLNVGSSPVRQQPRHRNTARPYSSASSNNPSDDDWEDCLENDDEQLGTTVNDHSADEHRRMREGRIAWLDSALKLEVTQAKYNQLLSQQRKNPLPGLKTVFADKLKKRKAKLDAGLMLHYQFLRTITPDAPGIQLNPKEAHKDQILLPSRLTGFQRQALGLQSLAHLEKKLRIGQAFDILVRLRKALGVRSFLTRHARKSNGYNVTTRAQETLKRAEVAVQQWAAAYHRCWAALTCLEATQIELKGLRDLNNGDLLLLSTWLEDEKYRDRGASLPWIWTVAPLPQHEGDLAESVKAWSEEGQT
ncbi:hypothetical protein FRB90_003840 [Tulasnella sp. 427]|nr:hypothetical protein FRB90_003840 [Tulasnella sp. 427]